MLICPAPRLFELLTFRENIRVNLFSHNSWTAPACITIIGGVTMAGAAREQWTGTHTAHFLTPETETSCHYHFTAMRWQPIRGSEAEETAVMAEMAEMRRRVFMEEDGVIIAAQQARILDAMRTGEDLRPTLISADAGIERCHRILRGLEEEERKEHTLAR
jgi:hypothetical protein